MPQQSEMAAPARTKTLQLALSPKVQLPDLQKTLKIKKIVGIHGCRTCGLVGLDLALKVSNSPFSEVEGGAIKDVFLPI
jgi:hypothetical protein